MSNQQDIILASKFSQPPIWSGLLPRTNLFEQLNESLSQKLTLVSAAAGFGKTSLINSWLKNHNYQTSWLSLDKKDNDISRFLNYLKIAVSANTPKCNIGMMEIEGRNSKASSDLLLQEITRVLASEDEFRIVVLDDYHLVSNPEVHDAVVSLLNNLPLPNIVNGQPVSGTHFILISRTDPPFRLARWRLNGILTEIRADDLRFGLEETAELMTGILSLNLNPEDVAELKSRSEGWVAGLRLVAVSLQGKDTATCRKFIQEIKGRDRLLFDYLIEEVFYQQPADIQDFLLKSSILESMSSELCDAIMQRDDSKVILEYLDRNNVFLVPLDHQRQLYRYLHFFADALTEKFKQFDKEEAKTLHIRAAEWFQENDIIEASVQHLILAEEYDQAGDLVEKVSDKLIYEGQFYELRTIMELFPAAYIKERAWLCLLNGWVSYFYAPEEMEIWLSKAERLVAANEDISNAREIIGYVAALRSVTRVNLGYLDEALEIASNGLAYLTKDDKNITGMLQTALGITWMLRGKFQKSLDCFLESKNNLILSQNICAAERALHLAGMVELDRGNLHHAYSLFKDADSFSGMSKVAFEWNHIDEAFTLANQYYGSLNKFGVEVEIINAVPLAKMLLEMGDLEQAGHISEKYAEYFGHSSLTPWLDSDLVAFLIEYFSTTGDFRSADHVAAIRKISVEKPFAPSKFPENIAFARSYLQRGDLDEALKISIDLEKRAAQWELVGRQVSLLAMQACILQLKGENEAAKAAISQALTLSADHGFIRTFVSFGEPVMELMVSLSQQDQSTFNNTIPEIISAFLNTPARGALGSPIHPDYLKSTIPSSDVLIEPLTPRELEILQLVIAERNNQEIADTLSISINTVKTHISNIFNKLGVSNRLQAANRSRQLHLT